MDLRPGSGGPQIFFLITGEMERLAAVAALTAHIDELEQAKREDDDDLRDDVANDGVGVVVGGATW
jgi:hypothetical protein